MEVIDVWTGRHACKLQAALRLTNEAFADLLGISTRTVATWHSDSDVTPRPEMQQLLDSVFERASAAVRQRFALLLNTNPARSGQGSSGVQAQPLRVAIVVLIHDGRVLLVCRRGDDGSGISWQFPAGVIKPGVKAETAAVRETLDETGVHCAVRRSLGQRIHPVTGVHCVYFLCEFLAGDATNKDIVENQSVAWVPTKELPRFIPPENIHEPILKLLEENT